MSHAALSICGMLAVCALFAAEPICAGVGSAAPATSPASAPEKAGGIAIEGTDIGGSRLLGRLSANGGTYTLGGGNSISSDHDLFYFVHAPADAANLIVRVDSIAGSGVAGIMFRDSLSPESRFAAVLVSSSAGIMYERRTDDATMARAIAAVGVTTPVWLRLTRSGPDMTGFYALTEDVPSALDWKQIEPPKPIAFSARPQIGLAVAIGQGNATFSHLSTGNRSKPTVAARALAPQAVAEAPAGPKLPVRPSMPATVSPSPPEARPQEPVASLAVSLLETEGETIDLTQATDWVHFGYQHQKANRKSGGLLRISDVTGSPTSFVNNATTLFSWSDGAPTRAALATPATISSAGGLSFKVTPGDTAVHTVNVYVGGRKSQGTLTAILTGGLTYTDAGRGNLTGFYCHGYAIRFSTARATDSLTIEWRAVAGSGGVQLQAAQLQ